MGSSVLHRPVSVCLFVCLPSVYMFLFGGMIVSLIIASLAGIYCHSYLIKPLLVGLCPYSLNWSLVLSAIVTCGYSKYQCLTMSEPAYFYLVAYMPWNAPATCNTLPAAKVPRVIGHSELMHCLECAWALLAALCMLPMQQESLGSKN